MSKITQLQTKQLRTYNIILLILPLIALVLSLYTLYVENNLHENPDAVALCDINEHMSCSKAFSSKYGKGFGFLGDIFGEDSILNQPNSIPGIFYYLAYSFLSLVNTRAYTGVLVVMSCTSMVMSGYLAYILIYVLKDICVVCFSIHFINLILLFTSYLKYKVLSNKPKNNSSNVKKSKIKNK